MKASLLALLGMFLVGTGAPAAQTFPHDLHQAFPLDSPAANDVRALAVSTLPDGPIAAATAAGVRFFSPKDSVWLPSINQATSSPAFAVAPMSRGRFAVGSVLGLQLWDEDKLKPVASVPGPVNALAVGPDDSLLVGGPQGYFLIRNEESHRAEIPATRYVNRILYGPDQAWWLATGMGLFRWNESTSTYVTGHPDRDSFATRDVAFDPQGYAWAACVGGIQRFRYPRLTDTRGVEDGLPSGGLRAIERSPDGRLWVGTRLGVARQSDSGWEVRRGRRWLIGDDVRDIVFDFQGRAWIATGSGVSRLQTVERSLGDKAGHFHSALEARHVRPPGIVEKCRLNTPGDLSTWAPTDDDNDGGYTALAMAMECFRYAVTRDPAALAAARRALSTCELLLDVTGIPGFPARTVVPRDWTEMHDPNTALSEAEWAEEWAGDPRAKRVPIRWRPSADGKWLWKGDTSSDEVTAHFFGYFVFHELCSEPSDRLRVTRQITRIADHLLENGFVLRDLDGLPTRWGVWAPERLNNDPDWAMERGINSLEVLSFLKLAHHASGEPRFARAYERLVREHHYDRNALDTPNLNPAWRTHIDMELLAFSYPALLQLETTPSLRRAYRASFERWHDAVKPNGNPFFEFLYAHFANPRHADLAAANRFLRETPLDLIRWDADQSQREDLRLRRAPEAEHIQTSRLLPVAEIAYSRTDQNPWLASQGDGGRTESDGVFWLLPYWMGLHWNLIAAH